MNQFVCFGDFLEELLPPAGFKIHYYALVLLQSSQLCKPESSAVRLFMQIIHHWMIYFNFDRKTDVLTHSTI